VSPADSPFTDPSFIRGGLYASADRLARRSGALHRAKVSGRHAGRVIADLVACAASRDARVADIGCGRGTTTQIITQRLPEARVVAVDLSAAMLAAARDQLTRPAAGVVRADFCHLPFGTGSCDVMVAAFCLYHSTSPQEVAGEIARCLRPGGTAILVTKSADSYRELDHLVAAAGLDPEAVSRPSLYQAAHSDNLATLAATHLDVQRIIHDTHRFVFRDLAYAAEYLATSPKYKLPACLAADPAAMAVALRARVPDGRVTTTSTVTYVTATRRRLTP
jgi:ubiquinone/menaquinone biosynthesis C-methylase UbiE